MWFIVVWYVEGIEIVDKFFTSHKEADTHMKKIAKIDGPKYAIAHSDHWHQLTSNPSWETTET